MWLFVKVKRPKRGHPNYDDVSCFNMVDWRFPVRVNKPKSFDTITWDNCERRCHNILLNNFKIPQAQYLILHV